MALQLLISLILIVQRHLHKQTIPGHEQSESKFTLLLNCPQLSPAGKVNCKTERQLCKA